MIARSLRPWLAVAALACLVASLAGAPACSTLEGTTCENGAVCPPELACCGQRCVAATCRNDTLDEGEECQTFADRACTDDRFDFGHVSCSAACTFDRTGCSRFGFVAAGRAACGPPNATRLSVEGDAVWTYRPTSTRVGAATGSECRTFDLQAAPQLLVAARPDAAIAVLPFSPPARQPVLALTRDGAVPVAFEGLGGALGPGPRVFSGSAIDPAVVQLGRGDSILTSVSFVNGAWRARSRRTQCVAGELAELRGAVPRGANLAIALVNATQTRVGVVSRNGTGDELARNCTALPYRLVVIAAVRAGARDFLIGNVTPTDAPAYAAVIEIGDESQAVIPLPERLGATGAPGIAPLTAATSAWAGPAGELYILGRRADGSLALLALRGNRWRELERGSEGRRLSDGAALGSELIALVDQGLLTATGAGYELAYDNATRTDGQVDVQVRAVARARGSEWVIGRNNIWRAQQNGEVLFRQLPTDDNTPFTWEPHQVAASPDEANVWFAAWPQTTFHRLFLRRGPSDLYPGETAAPPAVPIVIDTCGTTGRRAEAVGLAASNDHAFVAVRVGAGTTECPISYRLFARSQASRDLVAIWQGSEPIVAIATPKDGADRALVIVERAGRAELWAFPPLAGASPEIVLSSLPAQRARALWAGSASSGWIAGDEGLLMRFADGVGTTVTDELPLSWARLDGTSESDVFVAASSGDLLHFDGKTWAPVTAPPRDAALAALHVTPEDVYLAQGLRVTALRAPRPVAKGATCDLPP